MTIAGRRRDLGLGRFPDVSLAEARRKTAENLRLARSGVDPALRSCQTRAPTFAEALDWEIARYRSGWRSEKRE